MIKLYNAEEFSHATDIVSILEKKQFDFFSSSSWYSNFIRTVVEKDGDACVFVHSSNDVSQKDSVLPLRLSEKDGHLKISSLTNYYSPLFSVDVDFFCSPGFLAFYDEIKTLNWTTLELRPLVQENAFLIQKKLINYRIPSSPYFCFGNWYLPVNGMSYHDYFNQLSTKVRNTVTRKTKKFFNTQGARVQLYNSTDNIHEAISAYKAVYGKSWKTVEPYEDFIPGLIQCLGELGALRMAVAYIDTTPIAAQLWIVSDGAAYIYKLAYDENYSQFSAGTVLTSFLMKHVIDIDKVSIVDYLSGDDGYKKDWMTHRRERWGLIIFNKYSFYGVFLFIKNSLKAYVKYLLKKSDYYNS